MTTSTLAGFVVTVEQAMWLVYSDVDAAALIYSIEDYLGITNEKDFNFGWNAWECGVIRDNLTNIHQQAGWDAAEKALEEQIRLEREMLDQLVNGVRVS